MLEKLKARWNNWEERWNERSTRWVIRNWRKWDIAMIAVGVIFFAIWISIGEFTVTGVLCGVVGTFFLTMGLVCYSYDWALSRTGHLEEVLRKRQEI